jgi:A/G-specific adenine glycosylase
LSRDLLRWYDAHRRTLPWRDAGASPYRTWVSEVMLQQTRVQTVLPYFERWMARFPTVEALAAAPEDEVLSMWSGLGYYSRARNLHKAAKQLAEAGAFPTDLAGVRALPGVGEYIAGAIGSIALGLDEPAVDGNLERVLARVHAHPGGRRAITGLARELLPAGRAGDFNQALMDVGSGICIPKAPRCPDCPLRAHCAAHAAGMPTAFPEKKKKRTVPERAAVGLVLTGPSGVLLARRPSEGLFGGLFELPGGFAEAGEPPAVAAARLCEARLGIDAGPLQPLGSTRHTLTHMRITMHVFASRAEAPEAPRAFYTALAWRDPAQPDGLGTSTLARKALALAARPDPQQRLL